MFDRFGTCILLGILIPLIGADITLNMIVKNEAHVIERCLQSTLRLIDNWVIVDTGSNDDTPRIIQSFFARNNKPGELHHRSWVNFEHNRNEALRLAQERYPSTGVQRDYILFLDADEYFVYDLDFELPRVLFHDLYHVMTYYGELRYHRVQMISKQILNWKWVGVVHEAIDSPSWKTSSSLEKIHVHVTSEGASWNDPKKYQKHAEMLEKELQRHPHDTRSQFYLANSYRDSGQMNLAIQHYERRIAMGGWDEEVFNSMLNIGKLQEQMHFPSRVFLNSYLRAFQFRPSRIEPLYYIGRWYNQCQNYILAYNVLYQVIRAPITRDILFVDNWIYEQGRWSAFQTAQRKIGLAKK